MSSMLRLTRELPKARQREQRVLITLYPGIAGVGLILADILEESLQLVEHGWIDTLSRPTEIPILNEAIQPPRVRLLTARTRTTTFYIIQGDYQPEGEHAWRMADAIIRFAKEKKAGIITTGGIGLPVYTDEPRVYGIPTSRAGRLRERLGRAGVAFTLGDEIGLLKVYGMTGVIAARAEEEGLPGVILLAETLASAERIGYASARQLARVLSKAYGFTLTLGEVEKHIREVRDALHEQTPGEEKGGSHGITYIG